MTRWLVLATLAMTAAAPADILHLRDGSRHYGEVISHSDQAVIFRIVLPGGSSTVVQTFPATNVERVERTGRRDVPPKLATRPLDPASAPASADSADVEQMLRESFELMGDGDLPAALRAMETAVTRASPAALVELEARCREARGMPLDELLATLRVYVACQVGRGRGFKLVSCTDFERRALGRVLAEQAAEVLGRRHQDRTVADWAATREEYTQLQSDSRRLAAEAARASALLSCRLRYDPALKDRRRDRVRLYRLQQDLTSLAARLMSMPGYLDSSLEDGWINPAKLPPGARAVLETDSGPSPDRRSSSPPTSDQPSVPSPDQEIIP